MSEDNNIENIISENGEVKEVKDNEVNFAIYLEAVNDACNEYFANQTDDTLDKVVKKAKALLEVYEYSINDNIKEITSGLKEALRNKITNETEAEIITQIKHVVDIVEGRNLVLTFKEN